MKFIMFRFVLLLVLLAAAYAADETQHDCGINAKWDLCGGMCEPTCDNPEPNPLLCPGIQCTKLTAKCRCEKGYVKSESKGCVLLKDC
ncbi:chymotrypsin inhibitor-like [Osmia bicornis bicornis]|uniref:chymotrypsin inhibitor-like n=1 Tax=Osmia bicornis bicornis TaxID=1437191 RepID=UPI001EAF4022|nr:chymotrypsin inhibitor-like [Osmia bicornis bicornis]